MQKNKIKNPSETKKESLSRLKDFSSKNLYTRLNKILKTVPDEFLSETMITKKILKRKINSICYCRNKEYKYHDYYIDNEGEIIKENQNMLYTDECGTFLVCPICAKKRTQVILSKYGNKIEHLAEKYDHVYMITYTIRDTDSFNAGWTLLTDSMRRFRRMGQKRSNGHSCGESSKIKAAISCGEVKEGSGSGRWHLHFHQLAFCDDKLDYQIYDSEKKKEIVRYYNEELHCEPLKEELSEAAIKMVEWSNGDLVPVSKLSGEWLEATGGTSINIDVRPIKKDIKKSMREIIKYASKIDSLSSEKLLELIIYKDKKRFLSTWGELRTINDELDPDIEEDTEDTEENLMLDHFMYITAYDLQRGNYNDGNIDDQKAANSLYSKKEELKDFRKTVNVIRHYKNKLIDSLKNTDMVLLNVGIEQQKRLVVQVNSIDSAYRHYIKNLYKEKVLLNLIKTRKKNNVLNKQAKFYYDILCRLRV